MIPFGYLGSVCTRIGCPGDAGEETGYAESLPARRIASRYSVADGKLVVRPTEDIEAEEQAIEQAIADLAARVAELEAEQRAAGIHKYTPEQVRNYIDNAFELATTAPQIKAVVQDILKKMAVYILR